MTDSSSPTLFSFVILSGALGLAISNSLPGGVTGGIGFVLGLLASSFTIWALIRIRDIRIRINKDRTSEDRTSEDRSSEDPSSEDRSSEIMQPGSLGDGITSGESMVRSALITRLSDLVVRMALGSQSDRSRYTKYLTEILDTQIRHLPYQYANVLFSSSDERLRDWIRGQVVDVVAEEIPSDRMDESQRELEFGKSA